MDADGPATARTVWKRLGERGEGGKEQGVCDRCHSLHLRGIFTLSRTMLAVQPLSSEPPLQIHTPVQDPHVGHHSSRLPKKAIALCRIWPQANSTSILLLPSSLERTPSTESYLVHRRHTYVVHCIRREQRCPRYLAIARVFFSGFHAPARANNHAQIEHPNP